MDPVSVVAGIEAQQIAAGLAGTVTLGTLIMLILQNVKGVVPHLEGDAAEVVGGGASLTAVLLLYLVADVTWASVETIAYVFISWMAAWVSARAQYALLFKADRPPEELVARMNEEEMERVLDSIEKHLALSRTAGSR